LIKKE
jgi:hypothetical protein